VGMRICASSQAKKIVWEEERRRHPSAPFVAVERNSKGADGGHASIEGGGLVR
jgi:hypothetical protein